MTPLVWDEGVIHAVKMYEVDERQLTIIHTILSSFNSTWTKEKYNYQKDKTIHKLKREIWKIIHIIAKIPIKYNYI